MAHDESHDRDEHWRTILMEGDPVAHRVRHIFRLLPSNPRCKTCNAPFKGVGGLIMRAMGRPQSSKNPRYCEPCAFIEPGGAEVEVSMLFADVRNSTVIAEGMRPGQYTRLIQRFYGVATDVLTEQDALIDRLMGDEVIGIFVPGFAGPQHARHAVQAALQLRRLTGHLDAKGPWLPIGIGVHTGLAFVGVVRGGPEGMNDFTMLGDSVNVTARLASTAAAGEILISEATYAAAGLDLGPLEQRDLELKGKSMPVSVRISRSATSVETQTSS
jgi:adenylate cyclase